VVNARIYRVHQQRIPFEKAPEQPQDMPRLHRGARQSPSEDSGAGITEIDHLGRYAELGRGHEAAASHYADGS
jgi:hypothetical protein